MRTLAAALAACLALAAATAASNTAAAGADWVIVSSGTRLTGAVRVNGTVEIDFGLFQTVLAFEDDEQRGKVLREAGLKHGGSVATDVGVDIELKRWGPRDAILRRT